MATSRTLSILPALLLIAALDLSAAGYMAKPILFIRKRVSDRAFDWIMKSMTR